MRLILLRRIIICSFLFLVTSLLYNQLIQGSYYYQLSQNNRIKLTRIFAARGTIYDSSGKVLAGQRLTFNVAILPQETKDIQRTLKEISPILGISQEELLRRFKKNLSSAFAPAAIAKDVSKETAIALECRESDVPGLIIQTEPLRHYQYGAALCHILGYIGPVAEEELRRPGGYNLGFQDLVGRSGVEEKFDQYLRGQPGARMVEVNNRGYLMRVLGYKEPQAGEDLYLTVDIKLQAFIDGLLEDKTGACIVIDPQNGRIRALVSKPGFDPNLFVAALNADYESARKISGLLNATQAPLLNRAITATYAAGSIFKIVVACAGLETGKINSQTCFNCPGSLQIGQRQFNCWKLDGHGEENIISAITHSCNVFFYKLGLRLGPDKISAFAQTFGLGSATDIDLPYESKGLVPSKAWKTRVYRQRWYDGETANFSIGQGYLLVTPLQIARAVCVIANGGYLVQPHIVESIGEKKLQSWRRKLLFKKDTLEVIKRGMRGVVEDAEGTGHSAYITGLGWAAKTGTVQTSTTPHGWFAGYYPLEEPKNLVLVFLEYGGSGAEAPARIAKKIVEYIVENRI